MCMEEKKKKKIPPLLLQKKTQKKISLFKEQFTKAYQVPVSSVRDQDIQRSSNLLCISVVSP